MPDLKMRPRFAVDLHCDAETVVATLRDRIGDADPPVDGSFGPRHCVLRIPEDRRYFWSPELDVTFERLHLEEVDPSLGLRVRCLFTPRPAVWTGFAFVYAALAAAGIASALYGVAQLTLGDPPRAFLATAAAFGLLAGIYGATYIGQGLAATQMYELRRYLDDCLEQAEERALRTPKTSLDSARL